MDVEDQLGFAIGSDYAVERLAYSSGIEVAPFNENGVPYLAFIDDTTHIVDFWEKWIKIKTSSYCYIVNHDPATMTNTNWEFLVFSKTEICCFLPANFPIPQTFCGI